MKQLCAAFILSTILTCVNGNLFLLFANRIDVSLFDVCVDHGNTTVIISGLEDAAAIDFFYEQKSIFWTEISLEKIKRNYINASKTSVDIITTGLVSPDGLACDWIGEKLYWTDSETNRIEVSDLEGVHRRVLFWKDLDQPRAIAVDPMHGYLYWTDWGELPKIERAGMNGDLSTRQVLVKDDIYWPNGLALDYDGARIYWADAKLGYIHSMNLDGSDRKPIISGKLGHPFALTLFEDTLFWTDWDTRSIYSCEKLTGLAKKSIRTDLYSPMDVHVFSPLRQPKAPNPCGENNGGCSHMCLMSPTLPYYSCTCPTGVLLLDDKKTCAQGPMEILLLARRADLRRISLDTPDYTDVVLQLDDIRHAIAIDYDPVDQRVYWTDDEVKVISRAFLDGSGQESLIRTDVHNPEGIAVDWIGRNLYWTDTGPDQIVVSHLNGTSRKVLISENLDEIRAIALDPIEGYMYWTDWGKIAKIERAWMDGTHREVLINTSLEWPNGIAIDFAQHKLYWGEAKSDKIEMSNMDGTGRYVLLSGDLQHIFGFSILGNFVYWTDWQRRTIERANKYTGRNREVVVDQLPDLMGLKAVNVRKADGTNLCARNNGGCSHLCLTRPSPNRPVCACPIGLELKTNYRTCIVPEAFLLFSRHTTIRRISLETNHNIVPIPVAGIKQALALDFDINDNRIYWTDSSLKRISRAFMNGSALEHVIKFGLDYPEGMAVDWVAHNLYWADTGTRRIEVARLDGSSRKVLVWKDLENPRSITLDPPNGYMYWTDWGSKPKLERASLDGSDRVTLIDKLGRAQGLTIDYGAQRLYWVDFDAKHIESADMDGLNRRVVVEDSLPHPMGLTQYRDYIFWTDWNRKSIERANKVTGSNRTTIHDELDYVMDILVFHASRQSGVNPCNNNNGGCSRLCLATPFSEAGGNTSFHCSCPSHYVLNQDNQTCSPPEEFLLFSQKNSISRMVLDMSEDPDVLLPIDGTRNIRAIDYDPVLGHIYWIDGRSKSIRSAKDDGSHLTTVMSNSKHIYQPFDLAIDPYSHYIYWTCTQRNTITVTRSDGSTVGVVLEEPDQKPHSIVLDPDTGHMYWTNLVLPPVIERAALDGTERVVLFSSGLEQPGALAIDLISRRLYWTDLKLKRIESSDLSGGNREVLVDSNVDYPNGITIFGNFVYWIDKEQQLIERVDKHDSKKRFYIQGRIGQLSDIHAVQSVATNKLSSHPCSKKNGDCSHLCVAQEDRTARCSCPIGLVLGKDELTCGDPPTCKPDDFTCVSGSIDCIPLVWRCDGYPECDDKSDEDNCPKCDDTEFKCASGMCVADSLVCDGRPHCDDASDEEKCCLPEQMRCQDGKCIANLLRCDGKSDCAGGEDEKCSTAVTQNNQDSSPTTEYTVGITVSVILLVALVCIVYICCRRSHTTTSTAVVYFDNVTASKPLTCNTEDNAMAVSASACDKSSYSTGLSSAVSTNGGPLYDRNHVTGASSSSSTVTHYPKETLNPPPSPVTDRSQYTFSRVGSETYCSSNSPSSTVRSYRPYRMRHHIPPPPTTPCSTDIYEESEPYPFINHTNTNLNHTTGKSSKSRKKHPSYSKSSTVELLYESEPYPPPPTPRSAYLSDEMSCPPSPSTERSFFNPYPPPPSPVGMSDC